MRLIDMVAGDPVRRPLAPADNTRVHGTLRRDVVDTMRSLGATFNEALVMDKLLGHYGSPSIRVRPGRASYSFGNLYVADKSDVLNELAHAKQFHERPVKSAVRALIDLVRYSDGPPGRVSRLLGRKNRYEVGGSFEHEAHQLIRPQLENELHERVLASLDAASQAIFGQ